MRPKTVAEVHVVARKAWGGRVIFPDVWICGSKDGKASRKAQLDSARFGGAESLRLPFFWAGLKDSAQFRPLFLTYANFGSMPSLESVFWGGPDHGYEKVG